MDLTPTPDQEAIVVATQDWCRDNLPLTESRARPGGQWKDLEAMGWSHMTAPGVGLDHATEALVFAELGRFLAPVALLSSAVAARWAELSGKVALAVGGGDRVRALDASGAGHMLGMIAGKVWTAPMPPGVEIANGLDLSAPLGVIEPIPAGQTVTDPHAALHLQVLAAAFAVGCSEAARDMAAGYALIREQFERPIGWFQALKHMCSDMAVRCAVARSQLLFAACALDAADDDAAFHAAAAKRLADQAALDNARANVQVHGGIGMTDEASPHLCLKRAHLLGFVAPAQSAELLGKIE